MSIILHDLAGAEDQRFSPNCWRTRMALAHKNLDVKTRPARFADISKLLDGEHKTIPVIEDGNEVVRESFAIAEYLEQAYPEAPTLFDGARGLAYARFLNNWANSTIFPALAPMIILDIYEKLDDADKAYFRESREQRFSGRTLEDVQGMRGEESVKNFSKMLTPLRLMLAKSAFLGGDQPFYGDYAVFGPFQWARVISTFQVLAPEDPICEWINRCLDLHGGLAKLQPAAR
jgi:glutathione S-transferase